MLKEETAPVVKRDAANLSVLIVDDDEDIRIMLEELLLDEGYRPQSVGSSREAQSLLSTGAFDILLTDIRMPGLQGEELAQWTKEIRPQTEIIIMTGFGSISSAAKAVRLGAFDYLLKPFPELNLVVSTINKAADKLRREEELRRTTEELKESQANFANIAERSVDGIVVVTAAGNVIYANERALEIFDQRRDEFVGQPWRHPLSSGQVKEIDIPHGNGAKGVAELRTVPTVWGGTDAHLVVIRDVTKRIERERLLRASLADKEVLLKEVHHRVKNNLQVICSLLNLHANGVEDAVTTWLLRESQNRIRTIALIHEKLYQSQDLARIDFPEYVRSLAHGLLDSYRAVIGRVEIAFELEPIELDLEIAMPCALIINELISNALKHAFPGEREGKITVRLYRDKSNQVTISVADNGIGIPEDFAIERTESLGMRLIKMLVAQVRGELTIRRHDGAEFEIAVPTPQKTGLFGEMRDYRE